MRARVLAGTAIGIAGAAALMLGGCHKKDDVDLRNATMAQVQERVAATAVKPQPGRWEAAMKIENLEMPNLPPEARQMLDQRMKATHTSVTCLTAEQAAKPETSFLRDTIKGCTYDHFKMSDGRLDAQLSCAMGPRHQTMAISGTYASDSYAMTMTTKGEAQRGMPVAMTMSVNARRTGACDGREDAGRAIPPPS